MAKRLKKDESPLSRVTKIEGQIKAWRTKYLRASTALSKLEKERTYYVRKAVERGLL
jgi:hypothetical protein